MRERFIGAAGVTVAAMGASISSVQTCKAALSTHPEVIHRGAVDYNGMKTLSALLAVLVLFPCSVIAEVKHDGFDQILRTYVKDGHVRYVDIRDRAKFDLYAYLDYLANVDVSLLSREQQLAYYVNLYNASVMKGIIERRHSGFMPPEKEHELFKAPLVNLSNGRQMSLNDLANKVIRPTFKDPRINAALVYGAKGNARICLIARIGQKI